MPHRGKADLSLSPRHSWRSTDISVNPPPVVPPPRDSAMPSGKTEGWGGLGDAGVQSSGHLLPPPRRLVSHVCPGGHTPLLPPLPPASCCLQGSSLPSSPPASLALWSFISIPPNREFQWVSQLPMSGMLDPATLRQMTQPRCGVADTDSQVAWTKRVSALFTGRRAKMRRKKRFARQGEHC